MALSKVDLANQVENQLPQSLVADNVNYRNIIINGDMSIAQRGTSFSSISSGNSNYPVDRFRTNVNTAGTWTISQDTTVPTGQGFAKSFKMDCTTANASLSAGSYIVIQQLVEAQNLQYLKFGTSSAESLTLSFWVRSNKTGTYICEINSSDSNRAFSKSYTIDSADTWEKKTITYPGDTTGVINNDNGVGLEFNFWLVAGSDFTSGTLATSWSSLTNANRAAGQTVNLADSTANEWYMTGLQLEAGTTASDFEFLPYDVNLQRCERYYYKTYPQGTSPGTPGWDGSFIMVAHANQSYVSNTVEFPVEMRTKPTITSYSGDTGTSGKWYSNSTPGDVNVTGDTTFIGRKRANKYVDGVNINAGKYVGGHMTANAEL